MRVLQQLMVDDGDQFPQARTSLQTGLYVDDCLFGADNRTAAIDLRIEVQSLLRGVGFSLRKWASNDPTLLTDISADGHCLAWDPTRSIEDSLKILGVFWNPVNDAFQFRVSVTSQTSYTKRSLLSQIARFYDPLGWAAPVIISAKGLLQQLWLLKVDWDDPLPDNVVDQWNRVATDLSQLTALRIPRWKTFVANRVSKVQTSIPSAQWRHVPTRDNPADMASRGVLSSQLFSSRLWLYGPEWLSETSQFWPSREPPLPADAPLEERVQAHVSTHDKNVVLDNLAARVSDWNKFIRITNYLLAWTRPWEPDPSPASSNTKRSKIIWLRWPQTCLFPQELERLQSGIPVAKESHLQSLSPLLDAQGIIRVGGRLQASLNYDATHPVILSAHPLVRLIIRDAHQSCLHGGVGLTLGKLRITMWILQARKLIRSVIFHCVICTRLKAATASQLMGSLPSPRVLTPERPFQHYGVDYAGPLQLRLSHGRGHKSHPAYIAVFVCFAVKAIHLDIVSNYSASAFVAAFKRFVARRGIPSDLYSDRGTTFRGADTELKKAFNDAIRTRSNGILFHQQPLTSEAYGKLGWKALSITFGGL